jgi:hypothetical protein
MSKTLQDLDLQVQFSLVTRIRQAANTYKAAHPEVCSTELQQYLSALECLAEYVAAKRRDWHVLLEVPAVSQRLRTKRQLPETATPKTVFRVIPFPHQPHGSGPSPLTAA